MIDQDDLEVMLVLREAGLSITAIARRVKRDRKTVRKYVAARQGGADVRYIRLTRRPSKMDRFESYLRGRIAQYPDLSVARLLRELRNMGYDGSATALGVRVRELRTRTVELNGGSPPATASTAAMGQPRRIS